MVTKVIARLVRVAVIYQVSEGKLGQEDQTVIGDRKRWVRSDPIGYVVSVPLSLLPGRPIA